MSQDHNAAVSHNLNLWCQVLLQKDGVVFCTCLVQEVHTLKQRQHLETLMTAGLSWSSCALNTENVDVEPSC